MVVPHVIGEETLGLQVGDSVGPNVIDIIDNVDIIDDIVGIAHEVVEAVVAPLQWLLVGQPRLLQEVDNHVSSCG